jgi:hypothetical protein
MVMRLDLGNFYVYIDIEYDPETQQDTIIIMDEGMLEKRENSIRDYVRSIRKK